MRIEVRRITDEDLFREVAEMCSGQPCRMSWSRAIASEHSIIRAAKYIVKMYGIPQMVANHLVRHTHAQPYMRSKRTDRGGDDFNETCRNLADRICESETKTDLHVGAHLVSRLPEQFGRHAPTDLALVLNAQEFINISKLRLCAKASEETRNVWQEVIAELAKVDHELAMFCVPTCVYRGGLCPEPKSCGYNKTEIFRKQLENYRKLFVH